MTISRNQPLTTDDMARLAPSALAREASDGMSQCYTYIPTLEVSPTNSVRRRQPT